MNPNFIIPSLGQSWSVKLMNCSLNLVRKIFGCLKKEVILLGLLLLVRIVLSVIQVLMDYKLLLGKYSINFMELSDLFSYPVLLLIIYIAVKYHAIQNIRGKENNRDGNG